MKFHLKNLPNSFFMYIYQFKPLQKDLFWPESASAQ
jgi:hypothetical protein